MSKLLDVKVPCPRCGKTKEMKLYRTIWIEYPENRALVFDDKVNVFTCEKCRFSEKLPIPLLATNAQDHIAVWYEPFPDPQIDEDSRLYAKHMGQNCFYATAPRVREWEEFKQKIVELEQRTGIKPGANFSHEMKERMRGFIGHIAKRNGPDDLSPAHYNDFSPPSVVYPMRLLIAFGVLFFSGYTVNSFFDNELVTILSGLSLGLVAWFISRNFPQWLLRKTNVPKLLRNEKGVHRLCLVFGVVCSILTSLYFFLYADDNWGVEEEFFLGIPWIAIGSFLFGKITMRICLWVYEGFREV